MFMQTQAATSPRVFASSYFNLTLRARTASSVQWEPQPWPVANQRTLVQQTADLSVVLQELIASSTWVSGSPLVLMIKRAAGGGTRWAKSGLIGGAPTLFVLYRRSRL